MRDLCPIDLQSPIVDFSESGKAGYQQIFVRVASALPNRSPSSVQNYALPTDRGGLAPAQLKRVVDYIDTYLDRDLSLRELAQLVQLSPHYFSQLFKQSTGFSPHQYILRHRIDRGKQLLRQGGLSIAGVAKIVGFVDQGTGRLKNEKV
jgi:transcriptional regulator GlxA family with amidase domain